MSDLRKSVGLFPLIALGTAGVIGTSWIYTNGQFFAQYGAGGEIFGLAVATIFVAFIAMSYGELASKVPRAGGEVVYGYLAFNRPVGFLAGWLLIGAYVSSLAFYITAFGFLLAEVFPALTTAVPLYTINDTTVNLPVLVIGIALALVVCGVGYYGMRLGAQTQLALLSMVVLIGIALTIVGFVFGSPSNFWPPYAPDADPALQTLRFILPAMTFMTGFSLVAILAEDANLPPRRIGIAVVVTVLLAGTVYTVVLLASAWIIPWTRTAQLEQGTIDAYTIAGFPVLGWAAYAISVISLLTSFLALFIATSRIILAMSRAGLFPAAFAKIDNKRGMPVNALLFTLAVSLGLGWLGTGAIIWFLDTGGVYVGLAWIIGVLSLLRFRRRYPQVSSPYRVRLLVLPVIGAVLAALVIVFALVPATDLSLVWPYEYAILVAWFALGAILYASTRRRSDDNQALRSLLGDYYDRFRSGSERAAQETNRQDQS